MVSKISYLFLQTMGSNLLTGFPLAHIQAMHFHWYNCMLIEIETSKENGNDGLKHGLIRPFITGTGAAANS